MTIKEAIEEILSMSKKDNSLLKNSKRFVGILMDLSPDYKKELNIVKRIVDDDFLALWIDDSLELNRRIIKFKIQLENNGIAENWIDFIIDSFFTPLGWKSPKEQETQQNLQKESNNNTNENSTNSRVVRRSKKKTNNNISTSNPSNYNQQPISIQTNYNQQPVSIQTNNAQQSISTQSNYNQQQTSTQSDQSDDSVEQTSSKNSNNGCCSGQGCGCLIFIIVIVILFNIISSSCNNNYSSSNRSSSNSNSNYTSNTSSYVSNKPKLDPNITYKEVVLDKQTLYKLGYNPADRKNFTSVKIPYTFEFKGNHYKITKVGEKAFYNYGALQKVTIEEGVQILGVSAFENCTALTTVNLPSSINKINNNVFANCKALKNINLPYGITELRDSLFYNNISLSSIEIPSSVIKIGDMVFYKCKSLKSVSIPSGVTYIGQSAFAGCRGMTELEIPSSVKEIGQWAFSNCVSLNRVSIPDGVNAVGDEAFCNVPYVYYDGSASGQPWGALDSNKLPKIIVNNPVRLGGISLGENWQQVLSMYGTPDDIQVYVPEGYPNSRCRYAYYYNYSLKFDLNSRDYILDITTLSNNGVKTPHGIQVGDSESKLINTYGSDLKKYDNNVYYFSVQEGYRGAPPELQFFIENGKISKIILTQNV